MSTDWTKCAAPSADDIADLAEQARDTLPAAFAAAAREVLIRVEDFAPEDMLADLGIDDPFSLSGLYDGIPMPHKSVMDQPDRADTIWLFRRALLDEWIERDGITLLELVTHVYIHELAHHLGWSDDDIASIDRWWE